MSRPQPDQSTDTWTKDKRSATAWIAATLGAAILGWGIWATNQINAIERTTAVEAAQLIEVDKSSRERDKQVAELAAQAQQAIQAQLAQIQMQLAEIQRELRKK